MRDLNKQTDGTPYYGVAGSANGTIQIWSMHEGTLLIEPFKAHSDQINSISFSPDGMCVVSSSRDYTICTWGTNNALSIIHAYKGHSDVVNSAMFSPDGTRIVSTSDDWTIRVWKAHSYDQPVVELNGHAAAVKSAVFSPRGKRIASGSEDRTIRLWDAHNADLLEVMGPFESFSLLTRVAFSPDSTHIISASWDRTFGVWDLQTNSLRYHLCRKASEFSPSYSSAISTDGTRVAFGTQGFPRSDQDPYALRLYNDLDYSKETLGPFLGSWKINGEGWIEDNKSRVLLWLPSNLHKYFPKPPLTLSILPEGSLHIGWENLLLGESWKQCYNPASGTP